MFSGLNMLPDFSCFLITMADDSIEGIYDTLKQCALISKSAGGIGLNVHCIRATGSYIAGVWTIFSSSFFFSSINPTFIPKVVFMVHFNVS